MAKSQYPFICGLILFYLIFICTSSGKDAYDFLVERVNCEDTDPSIGYIALCKTKSISRTKKTITIHIQLYPNASLNGIYVKIGYFARTNAGYRRTIISAEENGCGFLAGTSPSLLIRILWPFLKKSSNIKDRCPMEGFINITDLVFEDEFLPPFLPEGRAMISVHIRNGPERLSIIKVELYIEIKPKGALILKM